MPDRDIDGCQIGMLADRERRRIVWKGAVGTVVVMLMKCRQNLFL